MKNINIIVLSTGYDCFYQAQIYVYNNKNKLIYEGSTYNGRKCIRLLNNQVYKIKIINNNKIYCTSFYVSNKYDNYYFNTNIIKNRSITFILKDYYYNNLSISKGELILWQKIL